MLYSDNQISDYKKFTDNEKKRCKIFISNLLKANRQFRTSAAIGQWFAKPSMVEGFNNLSKETILFVMFLSFMIISNEKSEQRFFESKKHFFSEFLNFKL